MHHDIDLTKKGAYALRHNPTGCPAGIEPRLWRKTLSHRIETHLAMATALMAIIDGMDGDCDLEEGGDLESSLGGWELHGEVDLEGSDVLDEPHDGDLDQWEGDALEDLEREDDLCVCDDLHDAFPAWDGEDSNATPSIIGGSGI